MGAGESATWEGRIESLTLEGKGVGIVEVDSLKRPIFVPLTCPGDIVRATILKSERKYMQGSMEKLITPGPDRVQPVCEHFGVAGTCDVQHVAYSRQVREKEKQLKFLFERKGLSPIITMNESLVREHYRRRSRVCVVFDGERCVAGYRKPGSHEVVPVLSCKCVHQKINRVMELINTVSSVPPCSCELTIVVGDSGKVGLLVEYNELSKELQQEIKNFFEDIYGKERSLISNLFVRSNGRVKTVGQVQNHLSYKNGAVTLSFVPENFIQANIETNELLTEKVIHFLFRDEHIPQKDVVLDLYAGIGNFSLPIAKKGAMVVAVEGNESSVASGSTNALTNGCKVDFVHQPVDSYLKAWLRKKGSGKYPNVTKILLDPPRTGCSKQVLAVLQKSRVPRIVYVSCNPRTLVRDIAALSSYRVVAVAGIDMFPDTGHMETVVLLDRQ